MTDDNDRTVFRPNPGGRRAAAPAQPAAPSSTAPVDLRPAVPPAHAPAYNVVAPPSPPSVPEAGTDDWIASRAPDRASAAGLPRAQDLRFEELVAPNRNPLLRSAGPLLLLLGRLRITALQASFASLMEQVAEAINFYEQDIRQAGVSPEHANTAKYLICATADDIVQNIPTDDRHVWTQYSMLSRFFGERIGGVRFFEELDRLLVDPAAHYDLLELQHACLALGFQGRYRSDPAGSAPLQLRQRNLYETLRRIRQRATHALSPRWQGQSLSARRNRFRTPTWAIVAIIAVAAFGVFLLLRTWITQASEAAAADARALHPDTKVTLQRRAPAPAPRAEPSPPQLSQLQRIHAALGPELGSCAAVEPEGRWIVIRICNLALFESGLATVQAAFVPIARRIAGALDSEAGPLKVVGHTDNVQLSPANRFGSNFNLSVERAKAVAALLRPALSRPERLSVEGKGPDSPIAPNTTADGRAKNRRVEVLVTRAD